MADNDIKPIFLSQIPQTPKPESLDHHSPESFATPASDSTKSDIKSDGNQIGNKRKTTSDVERSILVPREPVMMAMYDLHVLPSRFFLEEHMAKFWWDRLGAATVKVVAASFERTEFHALQLNANGGDNNVNSNKNNNIARRFTYKSSNPRIVTLRSVVIKLVSLNVGNYSGGGGGGNSVGAATNVKNENVVIDDNYQ
ncbi:hypothetical protein PIB30_071676, partial [Stylosanthes scabra]|nr:hypothetical protein [Stylosanthes scabra]